MESEGKREQNEERGGKEDQDIIQVMEENVERRRRKEKGENKRK